MTCERRGCDYQVLSCSEEPEYPRGPCKWGWVSLSAVLEHSRLFERLFPASGLFFRICSHLSCWEVGGGCEGECGKSGAGKEGALFCHEGQDPWPVCAGAGLAWVSLTVYCLHSHPLQRSGLNWGNMHTFGGNISSLPG